MLLDYKKKYLIIIVLLTVFIIPNSLFAQQWTKYPQTEFARVLYLEGNYLWVGTEKGLLRFHKDQNRLLNKYTANNELTSNFITAISGDISGKKWIGTNQGLDLFDGLLWKQLTFAQGKAEKWVTDICLDEKGNLWVSTLYGLAYLNGNEWQYYTTTNSGLAGDFTTCLYYDTEGKLWVGTSNKGLSIFSAGKWKTYNRQNSPLPSDTIQCIDGKQGFGVWVGTNNGLAFYNKEGNQWQTFGIKEGLPNLDIKSLALDINGQLWCGTTKGVVRYYKNEWTLYNKQDGLPDDLVLDIAVDGEGNQWFATSNGVIKLTLPLSWEIPANIEGTEALDIYVQENIEKSPSTPVIPQTTFSSPTPSEQEPQTKPTSFLGLPPLDLPPLK